MAKKSDSSSEGQLDFLEGIEDVEEILPEENSVDISSIPWNERARYITIGKLSGCREIDEMMASPLSDTCKGVVAVRKSNTKRMYVEASLLTGADFAKISDVLEIPEDVIERYALIYFDVMDMDRLDKIAVLEMTSDSKDKTFKMWALSQGMDFITWRVGKTVNISPVNGLNQLMSDSYFKARESFVDPSQNAKDSALKWTKQTVDIARVLKSWVTDADEAVKDIKLALKGLEKSGNELQFDLLDDLNN